VLQLQDRSTLIFDGANLVTRTKGAKPRKKPTRPYQKHGHYLLKRVVMELGSRTIDRRTTVGKALLEWRAEIIRDLGGDVSAQRRAVIDDAVTTKLVLDSIDNWLLQQPSLINARKRCLFPVVLQRQQLADSLLRHLSALGLERKAKQVTDLRTYLAERESQGNGSEGERPRGTPREGEHRPHATTHEGTSTQTNVVVEAGDTK
jgi:hypothetical protein